MSVLFFSHYLRLPYEQEESASLHHTPHRSATTSNTYGKPALRHKLLSVRFARSLQEVAVRVANEQIK